MSIWQGIVVFVAGFGAGMVNSVAGGGTLISFPALVWIGRDPIIANATNCVAMTPAGLVGTLGFRSEMSGTKRWILLFGAPSLAGGVVGALLLLYTPPRTFAVFVPYLILGATLLLAAQGPITRRIRRASDERVSRGWLIGALIFQFFVGVYGGYFGAGQGILMLAALGLIGFTDIHQMNGLKNLFAFGINGIAAALFVAAGAVIWADALLMAVGAGAGSYFGARVAHRLGRRFVRYVVIAIGLGMAASLFRLR